MDEETREEESAAQEQEVLKAVLSDCEHGTGLAGVGVYEQDVQSVPPIFTQTSAIAHTFFPS